ncbi:MAG: hypothetical protein ABI876_04440, partial [Bacteroidota bacterium]
MATESIQATREGTIDHDVLTSTPPRGEQPEPFSINPYIGIAAAAFTAAQSEQLLGRIDDDQVELRPDGLVYLPEIRYRRILNRVFGPGAWAVMPRSIDIGDNMLYYRGALFVNGRFVSEAIGEQQYAPNNDRMSYATAAESAKSNCLVRCCKDIGIASELWDPSFTRQWLATYALEVWCQSRQDPQKRKKFWRKKTSPPVDVWPWREMDGEHRPSLNVMANPPAENRADTNSRIEKSRIEKAKSGIEESHIEKPGSEKPAPAAERNAESAPAGSDRRLISPKQAGRFRAISRVHNWRERELNRLLALYRFGS